MAVAIDPEIVVNHGDGETEEAPVEKDIDETLVADEEAAARVQLNRLKKERKDIDAETGRVQELIERFERKRRGTKALWLVSDPDDDVEKWFAADCVSVAIGSGTPSGRALGLGGMLGFSGGENVETMAMLFEDGSCSHTEGLCDELADLLLESGNVCAKAKKALANNPSGQAGYPF